MADLLLILLAALAGDPPAGADWPQFLGPTRDGVYAGDDVAPPPSGKGPPLLWKRKVGQGFSGPVVAGGKVIIFHRAGGQEVVECLDAGTGAPIWSSSAPTAYKDDFGFDEGPRATPAVSGGRVFVFGAEGLLRAVALDGGKEMWRVDTRAAFKAPKGFFGAACSPLVEGGKVLLNVGGEGAGIVALDAATGKTHWTATGDGASYSSPVAATIGGARHAFFFTRAGLADLDPGTGAVRFRFPWRARLAASVNAATPIVSGDLVFISASYSTGAALLRVRDAAPEVVWSSDDVLSSHYATCVLRDGRLYGFDGRQEHGQSLRCVDLLSGKVLWKKEGFGAGTVTLAGGRLLIVTEDGELVMAPASPERFEETVRARLLEGTVRSHPALAGGRLHVRSGDTLACFDLRGAWK